MQASKRRFIKGFGLAVTLGSALTLGSLPAHAIENRSYILATATTGGTYYPVGVALATLSKVKLEPKHKISLSAISSAGSGENVKLLRENEAQFAIMMGLYGAWAKDGSGRLEGSGPQRHLRSVSMLWQNVEHFLVQDKHVDSGTVDDLSKLKGKKFSIGKRNSGTEGANRHILNGLGINPDEMDLAYMGYGPSADALQNGAIEGMNTSAGVPVSAVTRSFAALGDNISLLSFTPEQLERANNGYKLWTPYTIPANTYPGQNTDVHTIAQPNFLAVRDDIAEEDVYLLTKTIYENLPFLNGIHKATKAMSLQKAIDGLPVPLHPGAVRFYREQGVNIPDHLMMQ